MCMHTHLHYFGCIFTLLSLFIPAPFWGTNTFLHEVSVWYWHHFLAFKTTRLKDQNDQFHSLKAKLIIHLSLSLSLSLSLDFKSAVSVLKVTPPYILCCKPSLAASTFWPWVHRSHESYWSKGAQCWREIKFQNSGSAPKFSIPWCLYLLISVSQITLFTLFLKPSPS